MRKYLSSWLWQKKQNDTIGIAKRKAQADADAEAIAAFQKQFKADSATVTTADRGDGKAGYGSDIWMTEKSPDRAGAVFPHLMLVRRADNCLGVVRFDLSLFKGMRIDNAELKLLSNGRKGMKIKILGMQNSDIDEFYTETVTWNSFPAFKQVNGTFVQDCFKAEKVVALSEFEQRQKKQLGDRFS